jgi:hypothetical protein
VVESKLKTKKLYCYENCSRFDIIFVLSELIKRGLRPKLLNKGSTIIQLKACLVIMKDSYQWMHAPLASFPSMFGLGEDLSKGFCPYRFVTEENLKYNG